MPLQIVRNDITRMQVDAIVNAANKTLLGGGGVDGAIHRAAGDGLLAECRALGGCRTGQAKVTAGYDLPCKYVIHTVGPVWRGGLFGERERLSACYRNSLETAQRYGCRSIAFPLISAGAFGYPAEKAMKVAIDAIGAFLLRSDADMQVYLVVYDKAAVQVGSKLFKRIRQFVDDHYVEEHLISRRQNIFWESTRTETLCDASVDMDVGAAGDFEACFEAAPPCMAQSFSLEDALSQLDESFSDMVLRLIKEKGMKNADCYKKANLDKKLFSKINSDRHYKPKKTTAVALAIALELDLPDTQDLLLKAGFALSHSDKFDVIVEYFIREKKYDIFEINEALFYYDQPLLGSVVV